jgi:hypothetical protein
MSHFYQYREDYMGHALFAITLEAKKIKTDESSCLEGIVSFAALGILSFAALGIFSLAALGILSLAASGDFQPCCPEEDLNLAPQERTIQLGSPEEDYSAWLPRRGLFSFAAHIQMQ